MSAKAAVQVEAKERPIIFGAESVRAILEGRKTQTRRVVKPQPVGLPEGVYCDPYNKNYEHFTFWTRDNRMILGAGGNIPNAAHWRCPYGKPGERLWVREAWAASVAYDSYTPKVLTPATGRPYYFDTANPYEERGRWHSPIHMPRWASRITLELTDIRVERVQDITEDDARAEGVTEGDIVWAGGSPRMAYRDGWNQLNDKRGFGWDVNPWVWVLSFRRLAPATTTTEAAG